VIHLAITICLLWDQAGGGERISFCAGRGKNGSCGLRRDFPDAATGPGIDDWSLWRPCGDGNCLSSRQPDGLWTRRGQPVRIQVDKPPLFTR